MKKCLLLLLLALSLHVKAQTSYIEIISHLDMTSQFVFLDIGKAASYYISENGEKVKFRTGIECVRYLALRGWKLESAYSHELDATAWLVGRNLSVITKCYVMSKEYKNGIDPVTELELISEKTKSKKKNEKRKFNDDLYN